MSKKEEFKKFVLNKPELIDYVTNNNTSWQKLYEIYDLYGENTDIWSKYNKIEKTTTDLVDIKGIINTLKKIDLDSLEENISSIQKVVGLLSEFTKKDEIKDEIKPKEEKIEEIFGENE